MEVTHVQFYRQLYFVKTSLSVMTLSVDGKTDVLPRTDGSLTNLKKFDGARCHHT